MLTSVIATVDIELSFTSFSILSFMLEMFHSFNIYIKKKKSWLAKLSSTYKVYIASIVLRKNYSMMKTRQSEN